MRWNILPPFLSAGPGYFSSTQPINITRGLVRLPAPKAFTTQSTESNPSSTNANSPLTAIDRYFARFPSFLYNPALPATNQFTRLCKAQNFRVPHVGLTDKGKEERRLFNEAFSEEFSEMFGDIKEESNEEKGSEDRKQKWMQLALVVDVDPIPETITQFKKKMETIWVNIYDVREANKKGHSVRRFESLKKLSNYSRSRKRVFPLVQAKQRTIKFLLKKINRGK